MRLHFLGAAKVVTGSCYLITTDTQQILVDCDQDCLILKVTVDQGQCHVGYNSCFYRAVEKNNPEKLKLIAQKTYDPKEAYKK